MKKNEIIGLVFLVVFIVCFVSVCNNCSSGCSCSSCGKNKDTIAAGTYEFNKDEWDYFVEIETNSVGKETYSNAISSFIFSGNVIPLKGDSFENCKLYLEIEINGAKYQEVIALDSDGKANFNFEIQIPPTYETKVSYRVKSADGFVVKQGGGSFELNGLTYIYDDNSAMLNSYLDSRQARKTKVIYLKDYVYGSSGQKIKVNPRGVFTLSKWVQFFGTSPLKNVHTIIFDGTFYIEDICGFYYRPETGGKPGVLVPGEDLETIKDHYPNLKNIVIMDLREKGSPYFNRPTHINLPESGVNFYINDNTGYFTELLQRSYFVNGIYSFSSFDIEKYREEYGY